MSTRRERTDRLPAFTAVIDRLSHEGRGITHQDGKVVFVDGALPGETVEAKHSYVSRKYNEARVLAVKQASPERVEPFCPKFGICGGCSLQHMAPEAQIQFKQDVLAEQFRHFGGLSPDEWLPPLTAATRGYRRRARLGVRYVVKREEVLVGFREKRTHYLTDISGCPVLDPRIGEQITALRALFSGMAIRDQIPQMEVACGDDEVALVLRHMVPLPAEDLAAVLDYVKARDMHLYLQPAGNDSVHRVWPEQGEDRLHYRLDDFDATLAFHPMDFTQVNAGINQRMVSLALELLDPQPTDRVLDLFCGLGNFTLPLARKAAHVVGVEGAEAMVHRGYENARANGLDNVEFHAQDLTQDFSGQPWAKAGFDRILIDPPRSGALEVVKYLPRFGAKRVVYVSCNPATLARDAGELARAGYRLRKAGVMDMFTHTAHVESIAVFEKS